MEFSIIFDCGAEGEWTYDRSAPQFLSKKCAAVNSAALPALRPTGCTNPSVCAHVIYRTPSPSGCQAVPGLERVQCVGGHALTVHGSNFGEGNVSSTAVTMFGGRGLTPSCHVQSVEDTAIVCDLTAPYTPFTFPEWMLRVIVNSQLSNAVAVEVCATGAPQNVFSWLWGIQSRRYSTGYRA